MTRGASRLVVVVVALTLALGGLWGLYRLSRSPTTQVFGRIVPRVDTNERVVALTFDDGPQPVVVDEIIRILEDLDVRATFFLNGVELEESPESGARLVQAGHELGNHSYTHTRMVLVSPAFVRDEIDRTDALIRQAGHTGEIYFRPPYGKKLFVLPWVLGQTNRTSVTYDLAPDSARQPAAEEIARRVVQNAHPGSIILLHVWYESRETSREAVPLIVRGLRSRGFRFVTVGELLAGQES